jgi:hypothetical protein
MLLIHLVQDAHNVTLQLVRRTLLKLILYKIYFNLNALKNKLYKVFYMDDQFTIVDSNVYIKLNGNHGKDLFAIVSLNKLDYVNKFKWYLGANSYPVAYNCMRHASYPLHKFIFTKILGNKIPKGICIDHINRNKLDNRDENLRMATPQENSFNRSNNKNIKYKGIKFVSGKYNVTISKDKIKYGFTGLVTLEDAINTYNILAKEIHGEYAIFHKINEDDV